MTIPDILNELNRRNISIEVIGEKIRLHGSKDVLDESLVESIRNHKSEIMIFLSSGSGTDIKGRPMWCTECSHGDYRTSEEDTESLWCNLANQAVLDMQKCVKRCWVKNEKGWPVTLQ